MISNRSQVASYLFLLVAWIWLASLLLGRPIEELAARYILYDDWFYYLKIASNIANLSFSSFDGINETNGYHPLWTLLLAASAQIGYLDQVLAELSVWLCSVFLLLSGMALFGVLRSAQSWRVGFIAALLFLTSPRLYMTVINGLESSLAVLLLVLFFHGLGWLQRRDSEADVIDVRARGLNSLRLFLSAVTAMLATLARLDYLVIVLFATGILVLDGMRRDRGERRFDWRAIAVGAATLAVVAGYMVWNATAFGSPTPVSGLVKQQSFGNGLLSGKYEGVGDAGLSILWPLGFNVWSGSPYLLSLCLVITLSALALLARKRRLDVLTLILLTQGWVHSFVYLLVQGSGDGYYFLPFAVSLLSAVAVHIDLCLQRVGMWNRVAARALLVFLSLSALLAGVIGFGHTMDNEWPVHQWRYGRFEAARWTEHSLQSDARIGSWWAGAFGYYSGRSVVNLDGLVNSVEYLPFLRECRIGDYLLLKDIEFLADYFPVDPLLVDHEAWQEGQMRDRCWPQTVHQLHQQGIEIVKLLDVADPEKPSGSGAGIYVLGLVPTGSS